MFKKLISIFALVMLLAIPVYGSNFSKLTITLPIPEDVEVPEGESFYYGFKGEFSDVMAELNANNNYTYSVDIPQGNYTLYQIHDPAGFNYRTVINNDFTLSSNKTIYVYIQEKSGNYLNESLIPVNESTELLTAYGSADTPPEDDGYAKVTVDPEKPADNLPMPSPIWFWIILGLLIAVAIGAIIIVKFPRRLKDENK